MRLLFSSRQTKMIKELSHVHLSVLFPPAPASAIVAAPAFAGFRKSKVTSYASEKAIDRTTPSSIYIFFRKECPVYYLSRVITGRGTRYSGRALPHISLCYSEVASLLHVLHSSYSDKMWPNQTLNVLNTILIGRSAVPHSSRLWHEMCNSWKVKP
jgi:hypothetical protein